MSSKTLPNTKIIQEDIFQVPFTTSFQGEVEDILAEVKDEIALESEMTLENATKFIESEKIKEAIKNIKKLSEEEDNKKDIKLNTRYKKFINQGDEVVINCAEDKISHEELIKVFNRVLDSCPFFVKNPFSDMHTCRRRKDKQHKDYFDDKLLDIEFKLEVFENIPPNKIYMVIEDFIGELERYNQSKIFKKRMAKKIQNSSYKLIKKDIKIIEAYQKMIFHYTSYYDYNYIEEEGILVSELDEMYTFNLELLEELETKQFKILDPYRYGGTNLYNSTKKGLKFFFQEVGKAWKVNALNAKEMIDIL